MDFVIKKRRRASDAEIKVVGHQLERALWLAEHWVFVGIMTGSVLLISIMVLRVFVLGR